MIDLLLKFRLPTQFNPHAHFQTRPLGLIHQSVQVQISRIGWPFRPDTAHDGLHFIKSAIRLVAIGARFDNRSRRYCRVRCTWLIAVPSGIPSTREISEYSIRSIVLSNKHARAVSLTDLSAVVT